MINDQEYITTKLKKTLEKMIILSAPRLNNLIAMIIGIICSQSVVLSKISQELKDNYSLGTEESKIKRLQRFLSNEAINPEKLYEFFTYKLLKKYKFKLKSIYIIFDHTTIDDRFVILHIAAIAPPPYKQNFSYPFNTHLDKAKRFSDSTRLLNLLINSVSFSPSIVLPLKVSTLISISFGIFILFCATISL